MADAVTEQKDDDGRSQTLRVGFLSFVRSTFDVVAAARRAGEARDMLLQLGQRWRVDWDIHPAAVSDVDEARQTAEQWSGKIDGLLIQFATFVDARFVDVVARRLKTPVIVWALREPGRHGERLSLNSLTGANMAAHQLKRLGMSCELLYGEPGEPAIQEGLRQTLLVWKVRKRLGQWSVLAVGDAPDGFVFSEPLPESLDQLGVTVHRLPLGELFAKTELIPRERIEAVIAQTAAHVSGMDSLPAEQVGRYARLRSALEAEVEHTGAQAVAIRCWPEFFTEFGGAACSTVSALTENGVMSSCEADILGALSMDILHQLTDGPAYLGDLVEIDEAAQAVVFWHCGAGAFSLAREDTGAQAGYHPNRNIGFTLEFGLKPGSVTILRIGEVPGQGLRALIGAGEVLDDPQRFRGTSAKVRLSGDGDVKTRALRVMGLGFEPHYALAYGDVRTELTALLSALAIPVHEF
ncbi:MAG: L-fucose/L-arabinose isomerase family protein [Bacilli bacterium]